MLIAMFVGLLSVSSLAADKRPKAILDNYRTYDELAQAIRAAGIESSNLIVGIDFTESNKGQGTDTYFKLFQNRQDGLQFKNLHHLTQDWLNPYEQVITIMAKTLDSFDEDKKYPVFGFGDVQTKAHGTFPISADGQYCVGTVQVCSSYRQTAAAVQMSGPTSFAPIIEKAMNVVYENRASYHILVIITDGRIHGSHKEATATMLRRASLFPLSIIVVGVGDGPFDTMDAFDNNAEKKLFDNVQFVNFSEITLNTTLSGAEMEVMFATKALMEVPMQFKSMTEKNMFDPNYTNEVLSKVINDKDGKHSHHHIKKLLKHPFKHKKH